MCGPLSRPARNEYDASFNRKTDASLLTVLRAGKKATRNKTGSPWERTIGKGRREHVCIDYSSSADDNKADRCWGKTDKWTAL